MQKKRVKEKYGALAKYDKDNNLIDTPVRHSPKVEKAHRQAWNLARAMMEAHEKTYDRSLFNIHVYCDVCKREYCQGADSVDQYCIECPYKPYYVDDLYIPNCQKPCTGTRTCQKCRRMK
jgi:hypothetical protein